LASRGPNLKCELSTTDGYVSKSGPGELLVRREGRDPRRGFFAGYFKNPEATDEAWADGWFHTGDIVRQEADGSMFFVDRKKNVIRRSGENIAAVEVEAALMRHPAVKAAAVAAVADPCAATRCSPASNVDGDPDKALALEIVGWCLGSSPITRRRASSPLSTPCR
jgi:acyl-CoA synthetase (AMP-forming)/AMP-acid ligase II